MERPSKRTQTILVSMVKNCNLTYLVLYVYEYTCFNMIITDLGQNVLKIMNQFKFRNSQTIEFFFI